MPGGEAKFELTKADVKTILHFVDKVGYISHERHEDMHILIKKLKKFEEDEDV